MGARLLLVSGSLQAVSANRALLRAAERALPPGTQAAWFEGIAALPAFNPDLDSDAEPSVLAWRAALAGTMGLLIATPEYAFSMPGALKNALDWVVGTGELHRRPVALMSAGLSGGEQAMDALALTLRAHGAQLVGRVSVAGVRPKLDEAGELADPAALSAVKGLVAALVGACSAPDEPA